MDVVGVHGPARIDGRAGLCQPAPAEVEMVEMLVVSEEVLDRRSRIAAVGGVDT